MPAQQQFVKSKLAALEAQQLARYNTVKEAQTVKHLAKLDRLITKATRRSQERMSTQYTLEAKAKLLHKQQQDIQSTWQELDSEQSIVRRRTDLCLAQANHNKTQISRAQVSCCQCSVFALALSTKCIPPAELRAVSCCLLHAVYSACFANPASCNCRRRLVQQRDGLLASSNSFGMLKRSWVA